jgi:RNA polymerase sigma factor (sigma-70 family)
MSPRISIRLLAGQSDERLLRLVGEGHERAFEALVRRYRHPLLRYCRRMRLSEARAEDVLQQALLQAWLALTRGAEVRDLRPWLFRIVHNTAVNAMRGNSESHSELTDELYATTAGAAGESELDRRIAFREALTEVAALPQMQRQAIFLTAVDGQSHDEVASSLGITHGALRGLLYRARATLRSAAAALTPAQLIEWASGGGGGAATPTAERLGEISAGGGGIGITALLVKGAVVAATAGALAGSTGVVSHHHGSRSSAKRSSTTVVRSTASTTAPGVAHPISSLPRLGESRRGRSGGDGRRAGNERHGGGKGRGRDRQGTGRGRPSDRVLSPKPSPESPARADPGDTRGGGTGSAASGPSSPDNGSGDSPSGRAGGGGHGSSEESSSGSSPGGSPESSSGEDGGGSGQTVASGSSSGGDDAIADGSESTSGPGGGKGSP